MGEYIYPFPAGTRVSQNYGVLPGGLNPRGGHTAKDYAVPIGTPIWAACDGVIEFEGWVTGQWYENPWWFVPGAICIVLNAGPGKPTFTYGHLDSTLVNKGDRVRKGQVIGYSGNTGQSSGPHTHFEYLPDNWDYQNGTYGRLNPDSICEYWDGVSVEPQGEVVTAPVYEDATHWAIDISNFQGDINISAVNPDRVIIRASEGVGGSDAWMPASVRKARNAGKAVDFYHFSHIGELDGNTARAEADYFLSQVRAYWKPGDHVVLDWEARYSQLWNGAAAKEWMDIVLSSLGASADAAVFYSNLSILNTHHTGLNPYRDAYPKLWLAYYGDESLKTWADPALVYGRPIIPAGWSLWGWQFTQYGRVPGYDGNLDLNIIYGDTDMALTDADMDKLIDRMLNYPAWGGPKADRSKVPTISQHYLNNDTAFAQLNEKVSTCINALGALARRPYGATQAEIKALLDGLTGTGTTSPAPAPVLADKYRIELVKETEQ